MLVLILLPLQTNKAQEQHCAGLGEGHAGRGGQEGEDNDDGSIMLVLVLFNRGLNSQSNRVIQ